MLEFLTVVFTERHFPEWHCLEHSGISTLAFHGERPVILNGETYYFKRQDRGKRTRRSQHQPDHWQPVGKYRQVLPRRNGVAYAINAHYQVVRLEGSRQAPREYTLPGLKQVSWLGQYRDGFYALQGNGVLRHWSSASAKPENEHTFSTVLHDLAVSWEGKVLVRTREGSVRYRPTPSEAWIVLSLFSRYSFPWAMFSRKKYCTLSMVDFGYHPMGLGKTMAALAVMEQYAPPRVFTTVFMASTVAAPTLQTPTC
jgi:hypothetical protein